MNPFFQPSGKVKVLVLWASLGDAARQLVEELKREFAGVCDIRTIHEYLNHEPRFDAVSRMAIDEADLIMMLAHEETWKKSSYALQEYDYYKAVLRAGSKTSNQFRFVKVGEKPCPDFEAAGLDQMTFGDAFELTVAEKEKFRGWFGSVKSIPLEKFPPHFRPEELRPVSRASIGALLWILGFDRMLWSPDQLDKASLETLVKTTLTQNLRSLKAVHTVHSTIGLTIEDLLKDLSQNLAPMSREMLVAKRQQLANAFDAREGERYHDVFYPQLQKCIGEGLRPHLVAIEKRLGEMGKTGLDRAFVQSALAALSTIDLGTPHVPFILKNGSEWDEAYRLCRDAVSDKDSGFLIQPETYAAIFDASPKSDASVFWRSALTNSMNYYGSLIDFTYVLVVLFSFLHIHKASLTIEQIPGADSLILEKLSGQRRCGVGVVDSVVKWSNNLIINHIEAATPLFEPT